MIAKPHGYELARVGWQWRPTFHKPARMHEPKIQKVRFLARGGPKPNFYKERVKQTFTGLHLMTVPDLTRNRRIPLDELNATGAARTAPPDDDLGVCSSLATASRRAGFAALRADLDTAESCSLRACAGRAGR
jgi:hypothetical protein